MDLVKAEILFSRKCNLGCKHCAMVTKESNSLSIEEWKAGFDNLKKLGCTFSAFYGAEPFIEFNKLKVVLPYAESIGIHTTVITSGTRIPDFHKKLKELYTAGGKSLSMSYDPMPYDASSELKRDSALKSLKYWKTFPDIRDAAAIVTLTAKNFHLLPAMVQQMSDLGIWTFYDLIHEDRGMPGTKCKGKGGNLMFKDHQIEKLLDVLTLVNNMRKNGFLVHNSENFLEQLQFMYSFAPDIYHWCCARSSAIFPSWLTIDCDGTVLPCDDFHITREFKFHNDLDSWWPKCISVFREEIKEKECSCCWNTHLSAHFIKAEQERISDYIHGVMSNV